MPPREETPAVASTMQGLIRRSDAPRKEENQEYFGPNWIGKRAMLLLHHQAYTHNFRTNRRLKWRTSVQET